MNLEDNIAKLHKLVELESNWDGYDADPFTATTLDRAARILRLLENVQIFPTHRGSIQIEAESKDGYFEIEIFENKTKCWFEDDKCE